MTIEFGNDYPEPDIPEDNFPPPDDDPGEPETRTPVDVTNTADAADWIVKAIGAGPLAGMFNRAGRIVHTPREGEDGYLPPDDDHDHDGPAQIQLVDRGFLAATVQLAYRPYRVNQKTGRRSPAMFPQAAANTAVLKPDACAHLRRLSGITHTPLVRADGTVLDTPGYDPPTRFLYLPEPGFHALPIPAEPTRAQAARALAFVRNMIAEFPFTTPHAQANYLGVLLTPLLRIAYPPPYKLAAITAPQPGSGKTLLAAVARIVHGGVFRGNMAEDDAELRKTVTTILDQTTGPIVHIDNVVKTIRSATFASLLTTARWGDRKLGATEEVERPNDRLWVVTGNNVTVGGDIPRRTLMIEIDPGVPDPQNRTGFTITDLENWATANRGRITAALLTMVRAWVVAGRPTPPDTTSDGYAAWTTAVRGILTHAGHDGIFDDVSVRVSENDDDDDWGAFLKAVHGVYGDDTWTVKELLSIISPQATLTDQRYSLTIDCLPADLHAKAVGPAGIPAIAKSLGRWLANRRGRWVANQFTVQVSHETRDGKQWQIRTYHDTP